MKLIAIAFLGLGFMHAQAQMPPIEPGVSQELARWRAARYSDVRYKLNLTLEKMSPVLKGTLEIRVKVSPGPQASPPASPQHGETAPIILDWRKLAGHEQNSTISNVTVNGVSVSDFSDCCFLWRFVVPYYAAYNDHLIFLDAVEWGENVIKLDFTSPILASGSAITRYVDKEDGSEYIYSLFVPSDASTAFPVFDQPDLKARFALSVTAPTGWEVVSNTSFNPLDNPLALIKLPEKYSITYAFPETKPISTYVFAFAAGPWERVAAQSVPPAVAGGLTRPQLNAGVAEARSDISGPSTGDVQPPATAGGTDSTAVCGERGHPVATAAGTDRAADLSTSIYVRKSQAAKFKPHAAEVFRLNREAIKYFEQYFDYKFPFPKYDLVLIPEFPFGGMEHAGATFLRESGVIFPSEPTRNDHISRANLIFHEAAHQWFGDTVTMRWFDDLWLKEGFATFMGYKALEKIMPEMNAWKVFYERVKQAAYQTDSTKGTTAIYQPIANLSAAKSAYGNIVYNKAPAFLRQAEFYLGEDKFQTAVRAFLKKHEYANAGWEDLVREFEGATDQDLKEWARIWVTKRGMPKVKVYWHGYRRLATEDKSERFAALLDMVQDARPFFDERVAWKMRFRVLSIQATDTREYKDVLLEGGEGPALGTSSVPKPLAPDEVKPDFLFANYEDYAYGLFLLNEKSRNYVLKNIQNEKDPFLRSMMWGALWDSVREGELDPREYVQLAIKNLPAEMDETITASVLGRVSTAMTYYMSSGANNGSEPPAVAGGSLQSHLENMLIDKMRSAPTTGQKVTFYRAFLNIGSTENARMTLKQLLAKEKNPPATAGGSDPFGIPLKTKDRFDIVTRLAILGDLDAVKLLAELETTETSDDAKRYAYAARAAFPTKETKEKFWNDFVNNKEISESWIEAALGPFNSVRHADLTLPYLERALKELPNHKRSRKIFFVNGWLGAFIGGQRSKEALDIVNRFLAVNPSLDRDLRLKVLENVDIIERAVKIRLKWERGRPRPQ